MLRSLFSTPNFPFFVHHVTCYRCSSLCFPDFIRSLNNRASLSAGRDSRIGFWLLPEQRRMRGHKEGATGSLVLLEAMLRIGLSPLAVLLLFTVRDTGLAVVLVDKAGVGMTTDPLLPGTRGAGLHTGCSRGPGSRGGPWVWTRLGSWLLCSAVSLAAAPGPCSGSEIRLRPVLSPGRLPNVC